MMERHWEMGSRLRRTQYGRYSIGIHEGGSEAPFALISTSAPHAQELALEIVAMVNAARDKVEAEEREEEARDLREVADALRGMRPPRQNELSSPDWFRLAAIRGGMPILLIARQTTFWVVPNFLPISV
jgi:hypothetical protein